MTLLWILRRRRGYMIGSRGSRAVRLMQALEKSSGDPEHVRDVRALAHRSLVPALSATARPLVPRLRTPGAAAQKGRRFLRVSARNRPIGDPTDGLKVAP